MSVAEFVRRNRIALAALVVAVVAGFAIAVWQDVPLGRVFTTGWAERSVQGATPIALAAIGGLYAEKSGVFNIGLEGFMIFGAVNAVAVTWLVAGAPDGDITQLHLWLGVLGAVAISVLYTIVFAILLIRYEADQIVAGLAVWFLGLGFGPFTAVVVWGNQSSPRVGRLDTVALPVLSELPAVGSVIFTASPPTIIAVILVALAWFVLYYTRYGYWIRAAGENPEALDTAGVAVNRVRYASVIFSGTMAGLGGALLAVGISSRFTGGGLTMVDGRGWIGIVAYLFGNYNPIGAFAASIIFSAADMFQVQLQTVNIPMSATLTGLLPYVIVIVVLAGYGRTRMPAAVGEPYESES